MSPYFKYIIAKVVYMVNRNRMVEEFIELVKIDSLTMKERQMADILKLKLQSMGLEVHEDDAGSKIGGNAGNIICAIKGRKDVPGILLMAHMDTVTPGLSKKPVIEGDMIKTDGTTILGGDDVAGIECIMEALRVLMEDGIEHGDINIVFTVAEEGGLFGAKHLDYSKINAKYGFILDGDGEIGNVAIKAPSQNKIDVIVRGKAAHAGLEPEKGISAVQVAAESISQMRLGRIDEETTANIGIISGGLATNIICDKIDIQAEARSRNEDKLREQTGHMKKCFMEAADKFGGSMEFLSELAYPAFNVKETDSIITILRKASEVAGIELKLVATGGGSDTNIVNGKDIQAVDVSVGMDKVHSVEEQININDLVKAAEFMLQIIQNVE
jgi:tripeptide aminopeptidase